MSLFIKATETTMNDMTAEPFVRSLLCQIADSVIEYASREYHEYVEGGSSDPAELLRGLLAVLPERIERKIRLEREEAKRKWREFYENDVEALSWCHAMAKSTREPTREKQGEALRLVAQQRIPPERIDPALAEQMSGELWQWMVELDQESRAWFEECSRRAGEPADDMIPF
jgi:hypothetical protein